MSFPFVFTGGNMRIKKMLFADALDRYYTAVSQYKNGALQEFYRINVIKRYDIANLYMDKISTIDIANYRDKRLGEYNKKTGKKISNNTVRLEMALISNLFNIAIIEWGTCSSNPVLSVRKPKPSPSRERRLQRNEERNIFNHSNRLNNELYCIVGFALETAMRQGEILSMNWCDFSSSMNSVLLRKTKNGKLRTVPLTKKAVGFINLMKPVTGCNEKVFLYTSSGFKSAWRKMVKNLNIHDLHFHDLRHEAISRLYELGILTDLEISSISGHMNLNMLKRYAHLRTSFLAKKLNAKKKKINMVEADPFVPYPAKIDEDCGAFTLTFLDFDELSVVADSVDTATEQGSMALLRAIATRIKNKQHIPFPSNILPGNIEIHPL